MVTSHLPFRIDINTHPDLSADGVAICERLEALLAETRALRADVCRAERGTVSLSADDLHMLSRGR